MGNGVAGGGRQEVSGPTAAQEQELEAARHGWGMPACGALAPRSCTRALRDFPRRRPRGIPSGGRKRQAPPPRARGPRGVPVPAPGARGPRVFPPPARPKLASPPLLPGRSDS